MIVIQYVQYINWTLARGGGGWGGGGGSLESIFAGYVLLASQNSYPIIVCSVANGRPHLSHFWANVNFAIPTKSFSVYASTL